jgi:hypothetical protein
LVEQVPEQVVAQIADRALADVGHQERGEVSAEPLEQVDAEHGHAPQPEVDVHAEEREVQLMAQHTVHQRFDEKGETGRGRGVEQHGRDRHDKPSLIRTSVSGEPRKSVHPGGRR